MRRYADERSPAHRHSRREMLIMLGGSSMALLAGLSLPRIASAQGNATPEANAMPQPPYVARPRRVRGQSTVDAQLERSDIRTEPSDGSIKEGVPLYVTFNVSGLSGDTSAPLAGAQVYIWQADAEGRYSGVRDGNFNSMGQSWLRGYQFTDAQGQVRFLTIVPGWYPRAVVHIHFIIRTDPAEVEGNEFESEVFFEPKELEAVYAQAPYNRRGAANIPNPPDRQLTVNLVPMSEEELAAADVKAGYSVTFSIALNMGK